MIGLLVVQFANNAAAAPFHALLPDMVLEQQRGLASGIMGLGFWLGTCAGFIVPTVIGINVDALKNGTLGYADFRHDIVTAYAVTAAILLVMAALTTLLVHETPWRPSQTTAAAQRAALNKASRILLLTLGGVAALTGGAYVFFAAGIGPTLDKDSLAPLELCMVLVAGYGAARAFEFHPRRNPDFTWVVVTRMAVMMGYYMVSNFLLIYMESIHAQPNANAGTTLFGLLLIATATLSTLFAGWVSDRVGRKRVVYVSGFFMTIVALVVICALYTAPVAAFRITLAAGIVFGLGIGAYISVDWALVTDVLPSAHTFARDMGIWNIALTLPQVLALVLGSALLGLGAALDSPRLGFALLFTGFAVFCGLGTLGVRFITGVR
jgi:MFS family permease